ncbi:type II secretion system F family protein [Plantibacter sp. YIM 135347]|uniref:type II secretion system F family protein n=1 Tax=Plantibacter sp. YIM 135347 TaxID=3423919 RepID=UPI003D325D79
MVPMTAPGEWSICFGVLLGLGLWTLAHLVRPLGSPRLLDRTAPYLLDVSPGARTHLARRSSDPLPVVGVLLAPAFGWTRHLIDTTLGDPAMLSRRLAQAGTPGMERYRARQLLWAVGGLALGAAAAVLGYSSGRFPGLIAALVPFAGAAGAVLLRDRLLQRAAKRRLARIEEELPTILEFVSLSLAAGEAITDAIARVSRVAGGELSGEFETLTAEVRTGIPFVAALRALDARLDLPSFTRCVEQVLSALERGTPVAAVLRSQAQDSREAAKRQLLESAGKKEVAMLVPLVFLILPLSILIAVFPGVFVLQTGF